MGKRKPLKDLVFRDDYMFWKVLTQNKAATKEILEMILEIKIRDIAFPEGQKTIEITPDARGVRLDVYVEDDKNTVYNIEMQTSKKGSLGKRIRYYQGNLDLNTLQRGEDFDKLKPSFLIFICMGDYVRTNRAITVYQRTARHDHSAVLDDDEAQVVINAKMYNDPLLSSEMKAFLKFVATNQPSDRLTNHLAKEVQDIRSNKKWEVEYMKLNTMLNEERAEGRAEGMAEAYNQLNELLSKMEADGKGDEALKAVRDEEFRKQMFEEYHITSVTQN